mmetsp:Transcript_30655/g.46737  ORF Transcript_30655/g.46737 Transcript_30655/m.46737 type:complete len:83 (-) Transcript_30655:1344-1592(-)
MMLLTATEERCSAVEQVVSISIQRLPQCWPYAIEKGPIAVEGTLWSCKRRWTCLCALEKKQEHNHRTVEKKEPVQLLFLLRR